MREKHQYQLAVVALCILAMFGLVLLDHPPTYASQNHLVTWTHDSLQENTWIQYDKQPFVVDDPMQKIEDVKYWIIESNRTTLIAVASKASGAGPFGQGASIEDFFVYTANETWFAFPFTIHIPKALKIFAQNESFTCLTHEKGFDTIHFKFKVSFPHKILVQEWFLDEDTHLAKQIKIQNYYPNSSQPSRGYIMEATDSSIFLGNEVQFTANMMGFLSLIVGPILLAALLYKRQSRTLQQEKQRLESEEYRKQYLENHTEKRYQ